MFAITAGLLRKNTSPVAPRAGKLYNPNMIKFSNGHELLFANGSGALAFDGKGWWWEQPLRWLGLMDPKKFTVVAKTVTYQPKEGNLSMWHPWTCVRTLKEGNKRGATNAIGLTNPGFLTWIQRDYLEAKRMGYKIAASVKADNEKEAGIMAVAMEGLDLAYIEINVSCPNIHEVPQDIPEILKAFAQTKIPIVLKLSIDQVDANFVKATEEYVEAFHAINTIPWAKVFPDKPSPIEKYPHKLQGGVSGDFIKEQAFGAVQRLWNMTDKPIIAGGGISDIKDVIHLHTIGADAFSIGTLFLSRPWKPCQIVKEFDPCGF